MTMAASTIQAAPTGEWARIWYTNKHVLVTGGTSGIGAGLARGFIEAGAQVTVAGVNQAEIFAVKADLVLKVAKACVLEVRDPDSVRSLIDEQDALDVVVNCVGVIRRSEELAPEVFQDVVDINLNGAMQVCAAARPCSPDPVAPSSIWRRCCPSSAAVSSQPTRPAKAACPTNQVVGDRLCR